MAIAGGVLGWRTRRLRPALAGGLWTGMIASLIWYGVLLAVFYLFRGTAAQAAVFRAEGDFEDFAPLRHEATSRSSRCRTSSARASFTCC